ncbi:hypothetical protein HC031_13425 [Planosporangium thailandense]|uniref:IrrE N-terminal-like domain-containing protein n=2 Tax=Planosporangium thailandense TaxID=765197 RepID=A0ABX0XZP3_9ACTN|nr:hypothetical protein [Planosporangium thailandense]
MTTRHMLRNCRAIVDSLTLPRPFSVDALLRDLAEQRGRPIKLHVLPSSIMTNACGIWVSTATGDEIFVEEETTAFHREHIILHEVCHILCDHRTNHMDDSAMFSDLLPDLNSDLVKRLLARTSYTSRQEQEAELLASLIHATGRSRSGPPSRGVRGALELALGIRE